MTDLPGLEPQHRVLEVGTGSGHQTVVLSQLAAEV
jgi:protein-L-isoaspartate O-methyltransferase